MAVDTGYYSLKQFQVAIKAETTLGTANVTTMQDVNITDWPSVNFNPASFLEVRHGAGRVAKKDDVYKNQYGQVKQISFSGLFDQTIGAMLLSNVMGIAVGTSPASYDIAYNYTPPECYHGDTDNDNTGALTIALISPEGSNSIICPGCFCNRFKMMATQGDNGSRYTYEADFLTRHNLSTAQAAPGSRTGYGNTYRTLFDHAAQQSFDSVDVDLYKLELEIISNLKFAGTGANGIPGSIGRGLPEIVVQGVFGMKYDANTALIIPKQLDENDIAVEISNNATWASATFGLKGNFGQISGDFDIGDVEDGAFIDVPIKFMASTSGDVIQVVP